MENRYIINKSEFIQNPSGNIEKLINNYSKHFYGFNELYISNIKKNHIKAWKKHQKMTCNLFVIKGKIKFVILDDNKKFNEIIISEDDNKFVTIFPNTIFGFKGLGETESKLLNFSNFLHDQNESIRFEKDKFDYSW